MSDKYTAFAAFCTPRVVGWFASRVQLIRGIDGECMGANAVTKASVRSDIKKTVWAVLQHSAIVPQGGALFRHAQCQQKLKINKGGGGGGEGGGLALLHECH